MNRRHLMLSAAASCLARPAFAATQPWSAKLLTGGFDGTHWWAGLAVTLQPKWKTYWRVPGDGGIAPQIEVMGDNFGQKQVYFPMPQRFETEAGTTIGYQDEVVMPFTLTPADAARPLALEVKVFMGVCDEVCIPATVEGRLSFDPAKAAAPDQPLISRWRDKVPDVVTDGPVREAVVAMNGAVPTLALTLSDEVTDIFVEGKALHYFTRPKFDRQMAYLNVQGAKSVDELKGSTLRVTLATGAKGLEQVVTVG